MDENTIFSGVPADYHPGALSNLAPGAAVDAASAGLAAVYENVGTALAAEKASRHRDSQGRILVQNGHELFNTALPVLEGAITKVGAAIGTVDRLIKSHEAKINAAVAQHPEAKSYATELRGYYKSQKSPVTLLMQEVRDGDYAGAQAVLAAPAQLSGLSRDEHKTLREYVAMIAAPDAWAQLDAAIKARERLVHATDYVTNFTRAKKREWVGPNPEALTELKKLKALA